MKVLLVLVAAAALGAEPVRTMRLSYTHAGTAASEQFALEGLVLEGAWPGNPARPVDDTNLGSTCSRCGT